METTFTSVFYEDTEEAAKKRLEDLRKTDKYPEVKAYILHEGENSWRVLRKIRLNLEQPQKKTPVLPQSNYPRQISKRLKTKKAGH